MIFNMAGGGGGIELQSIAITTPPIKTSYLHGETFDPSGMVVTATYSDGTTAKVTEYSITPEVLSGDTTSVTVSVTECKKTATTVQAVSVTRLDINDLSWAEIAQYAASGQAANYFSVGDCKAVTINGTVGTLSVGGTYYVYIIGFNHNGAKNTIDFGTFKTAASGGVDVYLADSRYVTASTDGTKYFNMNHNGSTNAGGWKNCDLRYDILGSTKTKGGDAATDTATSPVSSTLMAALPSDLRAVMKPMTIYTDNTGGGADSASYVTASIDFLPLLAEFEIWGTRNFANSAEQNYQSQYDYFLHGNSAKKFPYNNHAATSTQWYSRSPYSGSTVRTDYFCAVTSGTSNITTGGFREASRSSGIAPIFRV